MKEETKKNAKDLVEQATENKELSEEELEQVTGGGAFDNVPRVKEHDYNDDIRGRI